MLLALTGGYAARAQVSFTGQGELSAMTGLPVYEWKDEAAVGKAVVVIVHGLTQEAGSLKALAQELASQHYVVVSLDQRGHGRWRYGSFANGRTVNYKESLKDLTRLCRAARSAYPGLPLFCIGESAGSSIVAQSASKEAKLMDGMVLASAGTRPRLFNLTWLIPDVLTNFFRVNHPVDVTRYISKYASHDPRIIEEMVSDPLRRNDMSGRELISTMWFIWRTRFCAPRVAADVPLLMVQGARDRILQTGTIRPLLKQFPSSDKRLLLFPEYGHVLLGTKYIQSDVLVAIERWLDAQVGRTALITDRVHLQSAAPLLRGR